MEQPPGSSREVSLDEAMAMAILFQQHGQLDDAGTVYRRILALVPDHPDALHYAGVLAHQQGRSREGAALVQRSLAIGPERADAYNNLGIILRACGDLAQAAEAYRHAIRLEPGHANAHSNLGVVLKAEGRAAEAETAYREAIRLDPDHVDAYHNLGVLLASLKRTREAVACFCKVTTLSPHHPETRRLLALAYCTLGEPERAVRIFEQWLAEEPGHPVPRHMLAACSGQGTPPRAEDAFVEHVFDEFASSFDAKLAQLSYRAPQLVVAMLADAGARHERALDVLDAGCGTGLCGPLLAPYARRLTGVDLSSRMLARAREKDVYDELLQGELTAYLQQVREAFDVIVSADTLVYFGAIDAVAAAAAAALRPAGLFIATVEEAEDGEAGEGYALKPHGRYVHTPAYVRRTFAAAGFQVDVVHAELRMESGAPVKGLVVAATKASAGLMRWPEPHGREGAAHGASGRGHHA
jgi:predicted TPR repeat methyltransferase